MERISSLLKILCVVATSAAVVLFSCSKNTSPDDPIEPGDETGSAMADTISNRLDLMDAKKFTGLLPAGPANSSLKISVADTVFLIGGVKIPIKFLHLDTMDNVAGVMIQIYSGGSASTVYFDVPEVPDVSTNDTVSLVLVGIDTDGLVEPGVPPAGGELEIRIVPHDENGNELADIKRPLDVSPPSDNISGRCGLVNNHGDAWLWEYSYSLGQSTFEFFNSPDVLWGLIGQDIQGCCTDGVSAYTPNCAESNKRRLNFQTFFGWPREKYVFLENGTYAGIADFISAVPAPEESDFCGNGPGVVHEQYRFSFPEGTWSVDGSRQLAMTGNSGATVAARPDGRIYILNCRYLVIYRGGPDGGGVLAKFYYRQFPNTPYWHNV